MRRTKRSQAVVAALLVVAMLGTITALLGAPGARVRITSPAAGARVKGEIEVSAAVSGSDSISYAILAVDEGRPCSTNSPPYVFRLDTRELADGAHRIFVEAYDRYGLVGSSKVMTIYVRNGSAPAVQASKPSLPRVASKPPAQAPARMSAAPAPGARAKTVSSLAPVEATSSVGPSAAVRGPRPEPVRLAAEPALAAARPSAPVTRESGRLTAGALSQTPPVPAQRAATPRGHTVVLNGRPVSFDVAPQIVDGRMRAGFRAVFEAVGAAVSWSPQGRTARGVREGLEVEVCVGRRLAKVNGEQVEMALPAVIQQGRTIIPLRFFADATGSALYWDSETRIASIRSSALTIAERAPGN